jgi:hypothetical protein
VPSEGKQREQHRADADRRNQEAPRHVVHDPHQQIDPGRRVKSA